MPVEMPEEPPPPAPEKAVIVEEPKEVLGELPGGVPGGVIGGVVGGTLHEPAPPPVTAGERLEIDELLRTSDAIALQFRFHIPTDDPSRIFDEFRTRAESSDLTKGAALCKPQKLEFCMAGGRALLIGHADGKAAVTVDGDFGAKIAETLAEVHRSLYDAARARLEERTFEVSAYEEMRSALEGSDSGGAKGWFLVPWRDDAAAEEAIKTETKATIRCYPLDRQAEAEGRKCFYSGEPATHMAIFARAF